jgi:hypothetical protein
MIQQDEVRVWPRPQEVKYTDKTLSIQRPLAMVITGEADWLATEAKRAAEVLNRAAGRKVVASRGSIALTVTDMDSLLKSAGVKPVNHPEGYVLTVTNDGVLLAGKDPRGVYYGAQTLAQMLQTGDGESLPGCVICDWPAFRLRGAHVYMPPRAQLDFFYRFLDYLAAYKHNLLVLEIGGGMAYDKHPEINAAWRKFSKDALTYNHNTDKRMSARRSDKMLDPRFPPLGPVALQVSRYFRKDSIHPELGGGDCLTKDEVRQIVAECAKRHIEVVPEVQALSHSYYLCCAHPEIAERQDDPWPDTYCPSNPKSYELLFDVMNEVIEVTQPRMMHVGHDEAYTFRVCPKCRSKTGHELLAHDLNTMHKFLASRNIRMIMWGDKLMHLKRYGGCARWEKDPVTGKKWVQPATWKAADMVPKDILIMDWYWGLDAHSERNFNKHGFEVIYGNYSPLGFKDWEKRAGIPYVYGAEMSSWCEVSPYEFGHNNIYYQFVPGADMLWAGKQMKRDEVAPIMARRVTREIEVMTQPGRRLVTHPAVKALPVDIAEVALPLPPPLAGAIAAGRSATTMLGSGRFDFLANEKGTLERAVVLDLAHRKSGPIAVGRKARSLVFVHGTTMEKVFRQPTYYQYHRKAAVLINYVIRYADDKRETVPAVYSEDLGQIAGQWPTQAGYCYRAVPVAAGKAHTFFAQEWTNPRPDAVIESITVELGPDATENGHVLVPAVSILP